MSLAGAVTGLEFTYANGVRGTDVAEKVLPPGERSASQKWTGKIGSWRAHMNVLQTWGIFPTDSMMRRLLIL
jgi:hypothetical protein